MTHPRMTYYTRVISNNTDEQILGWVSSAKNRSLYYGKVNALKGGESEYIIEFDIWNNEPGWDGGTPKTVSADAINCKFKIDIPPETRNLSPFLYAKCTTYDLSAEFEEISMAKKEYKYIKGAHSNELGVILGNTDHATVQTKIKLRHDTKINTEKYLFDLTFSYNYE